MSAQALFAPTAEQICSAKARELRVLTLTPFFPSSQDPTQGRFIAEPIECIDHYGIASEVIAVHPFYRRRPGLEKNARGTWKTYFCIPGNAGLPLAGEFLAASIMPAVVEKHRTMPFDLIHAHAALPCGRAAAIIGERLSIPVVVSVHGLDAFFTRQAGVVARGWCKRVAKKVYGSASAVVCISEKVREQVVCEVPANATVIYNGVDPEKFFPQAESDSRLTVLSVGNLIAIKGHVLLLRAFARVLREAPDCSLEIIGDGPERKRLVQLAIDLGIANAVHFYGRQSRDYVAEAMRRCTMFALPSAYEGLGCVYLEAMACAKPAIGCRGQGIEEIIEHGKNGMLVTPGDERELGDSVLTLLRDERLRQQIGLAARAMVLERLTLNHQAQQLAEIYRRSAP
jgi:glycosyltransferase involved in cell wall biosynthesis